MRLDAAHAEPRPVRLVLRGGDTLLVRRPRLEGDSLIGVQPAAGTRLAVARADVRSAAARRYDERRTVGAGMLGALAALGAFIVYGLNNIGN